MWEGADQRISKSFYTNDVTLNLTTSTKSGGLCKCNFSLCCCLSMIASGQNRLNPPASAAQRPSWKSESSRWWWSSSSTMWMFSSAVNSAHWYEREQVRTGIGLMRPLLKLFLPPPTAASVWAINTLPHHQVTTHCRGPNPCWFHHPLLNCWLWRRPRPGPRLRSTLRSRKTASTSRWAKVRLPCRASSTLSSSFPPRGLLTLLPFMSFDDYIFKRSINIQSKFRHTDRDMIL